MADEEQGPLRVTPSMIKADQKIRAWWNWVLVAAL